MEEVDKIILHFLRDLNTKIDENIKCLSDLSVETVVESTFKCIAVIKENMKMSSAFPSSVWQRIEVATNLASLCKDLGYTNDVGYQTFLYSNENELRQLFMFLIEKLPKETKQTGALHCDKKSQTKQNIAKKIKEEFNSPWIPPCCNSHPSVQCYKYEEQHITDFENLDSKKVQSFFSKIKKAKVEDTCNNKNLDYQNESIQNNVLNLNIKELKGTVLNLENEIGALRNEKETIKGNLMQMHRQFEKRSTELKNLNDILQSLGILELGGDCDILETIKKQIENLHIKSEELTSTNFSLKAKLNNILGECESLESEKYKARRMLNDLKETIKRMKHEYGKKEELKIRMQASFEKVKNQNKRSVYTKRILEIISNIEKQNLEINKIIGDTREIQKEINSLDGQLDRSFTLADETLFQDAKKDDQAKKAYKLLALLHSECNTIVSLIQDTSNLAREIIDLEDHIKLEKEKNIEHTLEKINEDISNIKK